MKKFKQLSLLLVVLILVFSLVGCTTDTNEPDKDIVETPEDAVEDEVEDPIDDILEGDVEDPMDDIDDTDAVDGMIESSDYISKIEVISIGQDNADIKVLDNIKKDLDPASLPEIPELEEGKTYLVFMKDEGDTVTLTDETEGIILLEGDNKDLYEKIDQQVNNQ